MAVYAVKSTTGPKGLVPVLLVFGAMPRAARTTPAPTQVLRLKAITEAMKAASTEQAKRRLAFALLHLSGPKGKEASDTLRRLPYGSEVLIYRTKPKRWEEPYKYISCDGETVVVQINSGRNVFRSTCVKPYVQPLNGKEPRDTMVDCDDETCDGTTRDFTSNGQGDLGTTPRKVTAKPGSKKEIMFTQPRKDELDFH